MSDSRVMEAALAALDARAPGRTRARVGLFSIGLAAYWPQFPGLKERLVDESGEMRRFINVYVNEEDIRFLQGDKTTLKAGDHVSIVPAIAGGR